jgi:hypothetical protein
VLELLCARRAGAARRQRLGDDPGERRSIAWVRVGVSPSAFGRRRFVYSFWSAYEASTQQPRSLSMTGGAHWSGLISWVDARQSGDLDDLWDDDLASK